MKNITILFIKNEIKPQTMLAPKQGNRLVVSLNSAYLFEMNLFTIMTEFRL